MNVEEMQKDENFEHEVLDRLKCLDPRDFDYNAVDGSYVDAVLKARDIILTAYGKEKEEHKKECHNCDEYTAKLGKLEVENEMLKSELEKEKEKNKEHKERITFLENKIYNQKQIIKYGVKTVRLNVDNLCKNFDLISKDKIKEIIYGDYEDLEIISRIKKILDKEE